MRFRKSCQCFTRRQYNMSRASVLVVLLCVVVFAGKSVNSSIILPKDVKVENVATSEIPQNEISKDKVEDVPVQVANAPTDTKCVQIGQFCMRHGDCCSNACLGYLKRCVSGSG